MVDSWNKLPSCFLGLVELLNCHFEYSTIRSAESEAYILTAEGQCAAELISPAVERYATKIADFSVKREDTLITCRVSTINPDRGLVKLAES